MRVFGGGSVCVDADVELFAEKKTKGCKPVYKKLQRACSPLSPRSSDKVTKVTI